MIKAVPLKSSHLIGFTPDEPVPMPDFPERQFGHGIAIVDDEVVLAVCGAWARADGVATLSVLLTAEARKRPITMHKTSLRIIQRVHDLGYSVILATPRDDRSAGWLSSLGFVPRGQGEFAHVRL